MIDPDDPNYQAFCDHVVANLWRFKSDRQYEVLSKLPKATQDLARKRSRNLAIKVSRIEHDEICHTANLYGMSNAQYVMMLHRAFKDHVVPYQTDYSSVIPGPGYTESPPESCLPAHKHTKSLGLPHNMEKSTFKEELKSNDALLRKAGI